MIADLHFDPADARGVRPARFVPRATIPAGAACLVANGIREILREIFGEACDVRIGEPVAIDAAVWQQLAGDAFAFVTCGRQTDVVLVVPATDARALVGRAFGETAGDARHVAPAPLTALELHALERIAGRCAAAFDPLCAERRGPARRVAAASLPPCVGYFEVRVTSPVPLELGIGIVRDLPDCEPAGVALPPAALARVPLELRVEFGSGTIDARTLLDLAPGDVVHLTTQVGAPSGLKIADSYIAVGTGGISGGRYSFEVRTMNATGGRS